MSNKKLLKFFYISVGLVALFISMVRLPNIIHATYKKTFSLSDMYDLKDKRIFNEFGHSLSNEIFKGKTFEQSIVLIKTIKFMLNDVDEFDKELIEFVRSLIIERTPRTTNQTLNLNKPNIDDFSQYGQSKYVNDIIFKNRSNGFFVESGAHDGERLSNSLFFEKNFNWSGLLIEPTTDSFGKLLTKNRNVYALNACLAHKKPIVAKFRVAYDLSGIANNMRKEQLINIDNTISKSVVHEYMPCFSLNTILAALNVNKVDFFSLDIEGGEWDVIESIDFVKFYIELFCIEWNHLGDKKQKIYDHLINKNYKFISSRDIDFYFHKSL